MVRDVDKRKDKATSGYDKAGDDEQVSNSACLSTRSAVATSVVFGTRVFCSCRPKRVLVDGPPQTQRLRGYLTHFFSFYVQRKVRYLI